MISVALLQPILGLSKKQDPRRSIEVYRGRFTRRCKKQKLKQSELANAMGKPLRVKAKK